VGYCTREDGTRHGNNIFTRIIPPLGHDIGAWTVFSTGVEKGTCRRSGCGKENHRLTLNIGDAGPGGGKIFYRNEKSFIVEDRDEFGYLTEEYCYYLEAAPNDMETQLAWASPGFINTEIKDNGYSPPKTLASGIGNRKNTAVILSVDANAPAAKACNDYSYGGKNDWYLPSLNELIELYQNKSAVGNFKSGRYWSATQSYRGDYTVYGKEFTSDAGCVETKDNKYYVRAIRAF
jgi:hypothetical protein